MRVPDWSPHRIHPWSSIAHYSSSVGGTANTEPDHGATACPATRVLGQITTKGTRPSEDQPSRRANLHTRRGQSYPHGTYRRATRQRGNREVLQGLQVRAATVGQSVCWARSQGPPASRTEDQLTRTLHTEGFDHQIRRARTNMKANEKPLPNACNQIAACLPLHIRQMVVNSSPPPHR